MPGRFRLTSSISQNLSWLGTTRARIGPTFDKTFIYVTGGMAYAHVGNTYTQNDVAGGGIVAIAASNHQATQFGWTAGGGVEWMFAPRWSFKTEYLYYDLGNRSLAAPCTVVGGARCGGATPTVFFANFANTGSVARVGLDYHFNWGPTY